MPAEPESVIVHPGDVIQDASGVLGLVTETHRWGIGVKQSLTDAGLEREVYQRLKPGQFVVIGTAQMMPAEVSQARRDSLKQAAELAREAGVPEPVDIPTVLTEAQQAVQAFLDMVNVMARVGALPIPVIIEQAQHNCPIIIERLGRAAEQAK